MPEPVDVVLDSAIIVGALSQMGAWPTTFPGVPPRTGAVYADALGVFAYPEENYFALSISNDLVEEIVRSVAFRADLAWVFDKTDPAMERIARLARFSGGGFVAFSMGVDVPPAFGAPARTAIRTAASKDLGHLRFVITEDKAALRMRELQPRGIPFPPDQPITFFSPQRFVAIAERVRWGMRNI